MSCDVPAEVKVYRNEASLVLEEKINDLDSRFLPNSSL
jgi:hypothetical protein